MTTTKTFDDPTYWHHYEPIDGGWEAGWRPGDGLFADTIARSDSYWGHVLDKARAAYGDPNMHFNTGDPLRDRYLVFGDGTPVPTDGSLAYHDTSTGATYLLNTDGSVSPVRPGGGTGEPVFPVALRRDEGGKVAPVDPAGQQVAPLLDKPTPSPYGYHDESGVLTPKNAAGDYYTLGPNGQQQYFTKAGTPITADQFTADAAPGAKPASSNPAGPPLQTDEQQSGKAAEAVTRLQGELRGQYSQISAAEDQLTEAMLTAHATTADGQQQLNDIQQQLVEAVDNPAMSIDTAAGQQAFLKFLRSQVQQINAVVTSGTLTADDQSKAISALTGFYAADSADGQSAAGDPTPTPADPVPHPAEPAPQPVAPSLTDPGMADLGVPPADPMPGTSIPDPGSLTTGMGTDPMSSLASMLPSALGGLGGLGSGGLGGDPLGLGPLLGSAAPLTGLASQLGQQPQPADSTATRGDNPATADKTDAKTDQSAPVSKAAGDGTDSASGKPAAAEATPAAGSPSASPPSDPHPAATPGDGTPPAAPAGAPAPTSTVSLPDGSSATAKTPALASAVQAYQSGTPIDTAYRQAGMELPPPGTPVTNPLDPSQISCGDLGMFKDHYVVAASPVKAFSNGQIVPLSAVSSSPDFLGWIDPTTLTTAASPGAPGAAKPALASTSGPS